MERRSFSREFKIEAVRLGLLQATIRPPPV